ncbi:MAG: methylated-DNA--[protein]-cysteine S-methyltransferase [Solirubrobacteraceae bacterium]
MNGAVNEETDSVARRLRATRAGSAAEPPEIAAAATAAGLADVVYATLDSPVGSLLVAATPEGLARVAYVDFSGEEAVLEDLAARLSPRVLASPRALDDPRRQLEEYFSGHRQAFQLSLDMRLMTQFTRRILTATAEIPYGSVSTYREVAAAAGSPRGFRAAGNALGSNPLPIVIPCHRVLHSGGGLGGYTGGLERKQALLGIERGQLTLGNPALGGLQGG